MRASNELQSRALSISPAGVRCVWFARPPLLTFRLSSRERVRMTGPEWIATFFLCGTSIDLLFARFTLRTKHLVEALFLARV